MRAAKRKAGGPGSESGDGPGARPVQRPEPAGPDWLTWTAGTALAVFYAWLFLLTDVGAVLRLLLQSSP
jgi:hypothetical protein